MRERHRAKSAPFAIAQTPKRDIPLYFFVFLFFFFRPNVHPFFFLSLFSYFFRLASVFSWRHEKEMATCRRAKCGFQRMAEEKRIGQTSRSSSIRASAAGDSWRSALADEKGVCKSGAKQPRIRLLENTRAVGSPFFFPLTRAVCRHIGNRRCLFFSPLFDGRGSARRWPCGAPPQVEWTRKTPRD